MGHTARVWPGGAVANACVRVRLHGAHGPASSAVQCRQWGLAYLGARDGQPPHVERCVLGHGGDDVLRGVDVHGRQQARVAAHVGAQLAVLLQKGVDGRWVWAGGRGQVRRPQAQAYNQESGIMKRAS